MKLEIFLTDLISIRIEQLLKLKKYSTLKESLRGVSQGYLIIYLDEKEVIHCDFVNALLKSRIPMNITY